MTTNVTPTIDATKERRRSHRYLLTLPCHVISSRRDDLELRGRTRDLSSKGAFLIVNGAVEPGASIEFLVTLQEGSHREQEIHIRCRGHVIRLEKVMSVDQRGVAATIDRYEFVRGALN